MKHLIGEVSITCSISCIHRVQLISYQFPELHYTAYLIEKKNQLAQPSMQLSMRATIQEGLCSSTSDSQEQLHNSLNNILL